MKKKILALCLVVVLAVTAVTGATLAYFSDTDSDTNVMTTGNIVIVQNETERDGTQYEDGQVLMPAVYLKGEDANNDGHLDTPYTPNYAWEGPAGDATGKYVGPNGEETFLYDSNIKNEIDKIVSVTNRGSVEAYVRTIILLEDTANVSDNVHIAYSDIPAREIIDQVKIGDDYYEAWIFTYPEALASTKTTAPSLKQVWLDPNTDDTWYDKLGEDDVFTIVAISQAAQTTGFANATEALDTAFGDVTAANIATWFANRVTKTTGANNVVGGALDSANP